MHVNKKLDAKSIPHVEKNFADNFSEVINSKSRKTTKPRITKRQTEIHFFIEYVICFELMSVITTPDSGQRIMLKLTQASHVMRPCYMEDLIRR